MIYKKGPAKSTKGGKRRYIKEQKKNIQERGK